MCCCCDERKTRKVLKALTKEVRRMSELVEQVVERVAAIENEADQAIMILHELHDMLGEVIDTGDIAKLEEVRDRLALQTSELEEARIATTPVPEDPTPIPEDPAPV